MRQLSTLTTLRAIDGITYHIDPPLGKTFFGKIRPIYISFFIWHLFALHLAVTGYRASILGADKTHAQKMRPSGIEGGVTQNG